jgi:peptidoglycan/LPS O-acetylase OafA/YrhL
MTNENRGSLAVLATGRDNNFNLLRVIAASLVVLTHAYGLTGHGDDEPLLGFGGLSLGSVAVDIFFVVSGFLIAKSWVSRNDPVKFFFARFMRIYPALWVSVLACVFLLGPVFTRLPLVDYFRHTDTLKFFIENCTLLIAGTFKTLPGVFENLPTSSINTPLWTLPYELKMYICLALLGMLGILRYRSLVLLLTIASFVGYCYTWLHAAQTPEKITETLRFVYFFFSGSVFYLFSDRIRIGWRSCFVLLFAMLLLFGIIDAPIWRRLVLGLFCPSLVMMAAFLPEGRIKGYNRFGDYSYGIYIFGMPVQQCVLALTNNSSVSVNFAVSYTITLMLAICSWHFVEKRMVMVPMPELLNRASLAFAFRKR